MLIATILESSPDDVRAAAARVRPHADVLELRLDALDRPAREGLDDLLVRLPGPVLGACRRPEDGGRFDEGEEARTALLRRAGAAGAAYLDVEEGTPAEALLERPGGVRFVLSRHDRRGTPDDLERIAARLAGREGIALAKLVTRARGLDDNLRMRRLLRSPPAGAPLAAFCMGAAGIPSRLLALAWGSAATYGAAGPAAAPGQLPAAQMDRLFRVREVGDSTCLTGIVGRPLAHSLSPLVHNEAYRHLGLDFLYLPLEARSVDEALRLARALPLHGFSVTLPHKVEMARRVDELEPMARRVGAVNTVLLDAGRLLGLNTDVTGGLEPLRRRRSLDGERVAVLGAGGASRALVHGLAAEGARVTIFNRTPERARALAAEAGAAAGELSRFDGGAFPVLVNATSVGMAPHVDASPLPAGWRGPELVYDLVYSPRRTRLLREAEAQGIDTLEGVEMFLGQAAEQFELFTDRSAPRDRMRRAVLEALPSTEPGVDG